MRFLDTNVIIRYLTRDDESKAAACFELFQRVDRGEEDVAFCEAMVAEVVYVLSSCATYRLAHDEVRARLMPILRMRGLRLPNKGLYYRALDLYVLHPSLDFEDVLAVAYMERDRIGEIYSYDSDFDRFPERHRVEP